MPKFIKKRSSFIVSAFVGATALSFPIHYLNAQAVNPLSGQPVQQDPFIYSSFALGNSGVAEANLSMCVQQAKNKPIDASMISEDLAGSALATGGNIAQSIAAIASGGKGSTYGGVAGGVNAMSGECDDTIVAPSVGDRCEDFSFNGKFDEKKLKEAIMQVAKAKRNAACQYRQAQISGELAECFKGFFESLKNDMQAVQGEFTASKEKMTAYVTSVEALAEKEEEKKTLAVGKAQKFDNAIKSLTDVLAKLDSASGSGDKTNMGSIAGLKNRVTEYGAIFSQFQNKKKIEEMNRTAQCFYTGGAGDNVFRNCKDGSGDNEKMLACIADLYEDQKKAEFRNKVRDRANQDAAEEKRRFLSTVRAFMVELAQETPRYSSVDDLKSRRGSDFASFGVWGQYVLSEVGRCNAESKNQIEKELKENLGTEIDQKEEALKGFGGQMQSEVQATLSMVKDSAKQTLNALYDKETGYSANLESACKVFPPSDAAMVDPGVINTQIASMKCMRDNLNGMLNNVSGQSANLYQLGMADDNGQAITCGGLRDCSDRARKVFEASEQKITALNGSGMFKDPTISATNPYGTMGCGPQGCMGLKKFKKEANAIIRKGMQKAASDFALRVQNAKAQLEGLKAILGKAGFKLPSPNPSERMSLDQVCPDSDSEICELPQDYDKLLAGLSGLPDVNEEQFGTVADETSAKKKEAKGLIEDLTPKAKDLARLVETCKKEKKEQKDKELSEQAAKKANRKMGQITDLIAKCKRQARSAMADKPPTLDPKVTSLISEMRTICEDSPKEIQNCDSINNIEDQGEEECVAVFDSAKSAKLQQAAYLKQLNQGSAQSLNVDGPPKK